MRLRYDIPVKLQPDPPTGTEIQCVCITIYPESGQVHYEFAGLDADGEKVGELRASDVLSKDVLSALTRIAYAIIQKQLGSGGIRE